MDRVANLLNDPNKTDYTYTVMLPYLNMAIEELSEILEESNVSPTNGTVLIVVPTGKSEIVPIELSLDGSPTYPDDLTEIQEVRERTNIGSQDPFTLLPRRETILASTPTNSLQGWTWEDQRIMFNAYGANVPIEVELIYVRHGIPYVANENSAITMINSRTYLAYKTAAFCAMFIGENESRASLLEGLAERAVDRTANISNKGRQQIVTRHRPFRASYKSRGGF